MNNNKSTAIPEPPKKPKQKVKTPTDQDYVKDLDKWGAFDAALEKVATESTVHEVLNRVATYFGKWFEYSIGKTKVTNEKIHIPN